LRSVLPFHEFHVKKHEANLVIHTLVMLVQKQV